MAFSSMKTSAIKLLIIDGLIGAYDRDHNTTPDVVRISNVSNMMVVMVVMVRRFGFGLGIGIRIRYPDVAIEATLSDLFDYY